MKKIIAVILLLLVGAGAFYYFYWMKRLGPMGDSMASQFVPDETAALLQITDIKRTKERWNETALNKIWLEPEVVAFMQKPKTMIPTNAQAEDMLQKLEKVDPKEIFAAVVAKPGRTPKVVAGFDYHGNKADAEALVNDWKARMKEANPSGKSTLLKEGSLEIETYAYGRVFVASTFKGHWFFASNDIDLLKSTIARMEGKQAKEDSAPLSENAAYKASLAKMPKDADAVLFIHASDVIKPLVENITMTNPGALSEEQLAELNKIEGISFGFKLDGEIMRDALYIYKPGNKPTPALERHSMAFTSADTMLYAAFASEFEPFTIPKNASDPTGMLAAFSTIQNLSQMAGLTFADFKAGYGPEFGAVVNWGSAAEQPSTLVSLDVRDKAKAQKVVEALTVKLVSDTSTASGIASPWVKEESGGTFFYSMQGAGGMMGPGSPAIALTDKSLLLGIDLASVKAAVKDAGTETGRLDKGAGFQAASSLVAPPAGAFIYIDTKAIFEHVYAASNQTLSLMAMFIGKLPAAETISKHLTPIVVSKSSDENGILMESAGPITFSQLVIGGGAGAAGYARRQQQSIMGNQRAIPGGGPTFLEPDQEPSPEAPAMPAEPAKP